jgi:hypothetical protein
MSFAGFSPQTRTALVILANTSHTLRSRFIQRSYEAFRALANSGVRADSVLGPVTVWRPPTPPR